MTIAVGTRVKITKGCQSENITKGSRATVLAITHPADAPYSAWILFQFPTHKRSFYVRYAKNLGNPEVKAHTGNPLNNITFRKA